MYLIKSFGRALNYLPGQIWSSELITLEKYAISRRSSPYYSLRVNKTDLLLYHFVTHL